MKCKFLNDTDTEHGLLSPNHQELTKTRVRKHAVTLLDRVEHFFPAGTILDHPHAYKFVNFGMATPADDECAAACTPLTPSQRAALETDYRAASLGIHDAEDLKLFGAGVIAGYEKLPNGQTAYLPGPNWEKWNAEQKAAKAKTDSEL